jgi:hypothetical protein
MLPTFTALKHLAYFAIIAVAFLNHSAVAGVELIIIENVQYSRTLIVTVTDSADAPISHVKVEEMDAGWKHLIRSSETDTHGQFTLSSTPGRKMHFLQLSSYGFNPLRVRIAVSPQKGKDLKLEMHVAT